MAVVGEQTSRWCEGEAATLPLPVFPRAVVGGRFGHHTEHLGPLLAVMARVAGQPL